MKIGIIGGGPAGMSTAISLRRFGLEVILYEATTNKLKIGEHLSAEAFHEFKKLEIPVSILFDNSIPCIEVKNAWGMEDIHSNESIFNPFGAGFILHRSEFDDQLLNYCDDLGVEVRKGERISKVNYNGENWELESIKETKKVDFLIDASGRNSKFRLAKDIEKIVEDQLIGITRSIESNRKLPSVDSFLLIESSALGWWYSVQLKSGDTVATFMTDAKILSQSGKTTKEFWEDQLVKSNHTKSRLKGMKKFGSISIQSAQSQILSQLVGENWLAVGDAAQSFDPLSSAGIIKGIKMGQLAGDKIFDFLKGRINALKEYENEIRDQFQDYLNKKKEYYEKENRWMNEIFWFKRNLDVKSIQYFTVHPEYELQVVDDSPDEKLDFLDQQIPDINFNLLFESVKDFPQAKEAIQNYLLKQNRTQMHPLMLHAMESLKLIGIVR